MSETFHIADLIVKKIRGTITADELKKLEQWMGESPENQELYARASDPKQQLEKVQIYHLFEKEKAWGKLEDELFGRETIRFVSRRYVRFAAAILLPLLVAGGFSWWYLRSPSPQTLAEIDQEIKPGAEKAVLILSDGGQVELGQGISHDPIYDGGVRITDENQGITYSRDRSQSGEDVLYNELRTPRGGGYRLQLADGTGVWLNAGSSLRFPLAFSDTTRQVFLEGEAYFEVNRDGKSFIVSTGSMQTRVLGTSFNVSAYAEDAAFVTTLVEGRVQVELLDQQKRISATTILEPDQQATFSRSGKLLTKADVQASGYVSWIQGKLEFHNENLETVMKKLARWYDFEYSFENQEARNYHFSARLDREENISSILEMLEMTTDVKFAYRENHIVIQ